MSAYKSPEQFELWADLSRQNRFLRRLAVALLAGLLLLVAALALLATRPLVAVRVDKLGRADLVQNIAPSNGPGPEEAEHVSRLISQYLLEVTSGSVQRDLTKALGLMTQQFGRAYREQVKDDPTLARLEQGNVRTQVSFDSSRTEVKAEKGEDGRVIRYFVQLLGKVEVYRQDTFTAPLAQSPVQVRVTLLAVPRGPNTLNGLLVDYFEKTFLEPQVAAPPSSSPLPPPSAGAVP
jgi:hypothetical protein